MNTTFKMTKNDQKFKSENIYIIIAKTRYKNTKVEANKSITKQAQNKYILDSIDSFSDYGFGPRVPNDLTLLHSSIIYSR